MSRCGKSLKRVAWRSPEGLVGWIANPSTAVPGSIPHLHHHFARLLSHPTTCSAHSFLTSPSCPPFPATLTDTQKVSPTSQSISLHHCCLYTNSKLESFYSPCISGSVSWGPTPGLLLTMLTAEPLSCSMLMYLQDIIMISYAQYTCLTFIS